MGDIKEVCDNIKVSEKLDMHINSFMVMGSTYLTMMMVLQYTLFKFNIFFNEDVVKFEQYNERKG